VEWASTPWYVFVVSAIVVPVMTEALKKLPLAGQFKAGLAFLASALIAAGGLLLDGRLTWETLVPNLGVVFMTATLVYRLFKGGGGLSALVAWPLVLLVAAICATGCTSYTVNIHENAIRYADSVTFPPGLGEGSSDSGGATATASGGDKGSPGNNNILDGLALLGVIITVGGESTPTSEATLDATVTPAP
jgi:hypothetical protein